MNLSRISLRGRPTAAIFKATFAVGDGRKKGWQQPEPGLADWRRARLIHDVLLLNEEQRKTVEYECRRHCDHRDWRLWAVNARSNHVHVVATAPGCSGKTVRDQLKANGTRGLREHWAVFHNRAVWTVGGDWECINTEDDLATVCEYVREAQDRMDRKQE